MPRFAYSPSNKFIGVKPNFIWDVNLEYTRTSSQFISTDHNAVINMICNVLFTVPGERVFEPEFGSELPFLLHEPMNELTAWKIENESAYAISRWIPYVVVNRRDTRVIPDYDAGSYSVKIPYQELTPSSFYDRAKTFDADIFAVR